MFAVKEKQKLIEEGKIKKRPLPPNAEDEIPFDIPNSWMWCQLGDVTTYPQTKVKINGKDICSNIWSLDLEDIEKDTGKILNIVQSSERKIKGEIKRAKEFYIVQCQECNKKRTVSKR